MSKRRLSDVENLESSDEEFDFENFNDENIFDISNEFFLSDSGSSVLGFRKNKSEPEDESDNNTNWEDVSLKDSIPKRFSFYVGKDIGPQISMLQTPVEPVDIFKLFFTDNLIRNIVQQTNLYAKLKIEKANLSKCSTWNDWRDVTSEEIKAFIGVILNMGLIPLNNVQNYWSKEHSSKIPWFAEIFTRKRFFQIFWNLHLNENATGNQDLRTRTQKVSNFLNYLEEKFRTYFIPGEEISVGESVINFKGKICLISNNPKNPTEWRIRVYVLADSNTGYIYAILPYYGNITSENLIKPELPLSARIVLHLYDKLLKDHPDAQGYHIFTDRYYTSLPLAKELLELKCHITGTIQTNRRYLPDIIRKPRFTNGKSVALRNGNYLLLAWKDKRVVTMLSTYDVSEMVNVTRCERGGGQHDIMKPRVVINYTKNMGRTDRADHLVSSYSFLPKTLKWWKKMFYWGLQAAVINSYILYKEMSRKGQAFPVSPEKFQRLLLNQLVGDFRQGSVNSGRHSTSDQEERLNGKLHIIRSDPKRTKICMVCSTPAGPGRKRTTFYCDTCTRKPGLHVGDCFMNYHTRKVYKK